MSQTYSPDLSKESPIAHAQPYLTVIVPCFNEALTIEHTAETVINYLQSKWPDFDYELILIDDGSTDQTAVLMKALQEQYKQVRCLFFPINQGRAAAIKAGIAVSAGKYVVLLDADLSYDENHIGEILTSFRAYPDTDVVVVSAYMKGGVTRAVPWNRLVISRLANWILSGFFASNLSTVTCVVRGYNGDKIRNLPLFEDGKQLHLEILRKMALSGAVIREIPGRLIWKQSQQNRRKNNLNVAGSALKHIVYCTLVNPTRLFKYLGILLFLLGLYEAGTILYNVLVSYEPQVNFLFDLSQAFKKSYAQSPHTFILAGVALILGFQTLSFLAIVEINRMQHEETLRHQLEILSRLPNRK